MRAQLDDLAGDERLSADSRPIVEWFIDEVRSAKSNGRLDELTALFPHAGIRRKRWWHGRPTAIESGAYTDDEDEDQDDPDDDADAGMLAIAAAPARVNCAAQLAARSWTLRHPGDGRCHVVNAYGEDCAGLAEHAIPGGAICERHRQALAIPYTARRV
jgi:hypothetical protein